MTWSTIYRALLLIGVVLPGGRAMAQGAGELTRPPNDTIPFAPLVRPSHFWIGWPEDAMYEGDINIPVHLWSRTSALAQPTSPLPSSYDCLPRPIARVMAGIGRIVGLPGTASTPTGCTVNFVPHFVIRQLKGGSAPVRTPTFNPTFEFNRFRLILHEAPDSTAVAGRTGILLGNHLRIAHYSNGQSGCLYTNQTPDTCTTIEGEEETLNKEDGSFSTHYLEAGNTLALLKFDRAGTDRLLLGATYSLRYHPPRLAKIGGMSDEHARTYGRQSLLGTAMLRSRTRIADMPVVGTLLLDGECALRRPEGYDSCRGSAGVSLTFPALYGFGIAARYVAGWDYYNVGYGDRLRNPGTWRPMIGLTIDHSNAMRIR